MLTPAYLNSFRKSYKNLRKGGKITRMEVEIVILMIAKGDILPIKYKDHKLGGEYEGYKECHIKRDILLIYKIDKLNSLLTLKNIGTHSELF